MPTRIVFRETVSSASTSPQSAAASRRLQQQHHYHDRIPRIASSGPTKNTTTLTGATAAVGAHVDQGNSDDNLDLQRAASAETAETRQSHRSSVGKKSIMRFRSSILRELDVRAYDEDDLLGPDAEYTRQQQGLRGLSSHDIRASPRLLGYLFSVIAGTVMMVSTIQFYRSERLDDVDQSADRKSKYVSLTGGLVYRWKLWGAVYVSCIGVGLCLITVLAHFDTVIAPRLWVYMFRDGSLAERNWIIMLCLLWLAGVHIATSSLSVGESQANVFFTTWVSFASMALNYGVWRESAGLPTLADKFNLHHRETTYNWMWTGLFSVIFAASTTDIYFNRHELVFRFRGRTLDLTNGDWILILAIVWTEVGVCALAVIFNEWLRESWQLPCRFQCGHAKYRFVFGWRQFEGLIILTAIGAKFWVILQYTGSGGVINGLSNAYFAVWGTFLNSVFAFGTWLRENKNMEYVVQESSRDEEIGNAERT